MAIVNSSLLRRLRNTGIALIVGVLGVSQFVYAASDTKSIAIEGANVTYVPNELWFSVLWIKPAFSRPVSYEYHPYEDLLNERLKANGYEIDVTKGGIQLAIFEDYAGKISDYKPPIERDTASAKVGAIVMAIAEAAIVKGIGGSPATTMVNKSNSFVTRDFSNSQVPELTGQNADRWLVIARVCSAVGKKCGSSVAVATNDNISLDDLRTINMLQGLTRSVGLAP